MNTKSKQPVVSSSEEDQRKLAAILNRGFQRKAPSLPPLDPITLPTQPLPEVCQDLIAHLAHLRQPENFRPHCAELGTAALDVAIAALQTVAAHSAGLTLEDLR